MADELVTFMIFADPNEANVVKTKLESEGIFCFLANEELMFSPNLRTVIGQVELKVKPQDLKKAKRIINVAQAS